jgi:Fe-S-cluster containining protein
VIAIAEHIRETFSPDQVSATKQRLSQLEVSISGLSDQQRKAANLPCALLVDGKCSIYSNRPLVCAGFNSYDANICERSTQGLEAEIPWYGPQAIAHMKTSEGVKQGLAQIGLSGADLELTSA